MEQEHRITYKAGITRTPSDFLCADGELAECINLATDNEELKPMVQPAEVIDTFTPIVPVLQGFHLLYVHKFNDEERYIGYTYDSGVGHNENYLCYATKTGNKELTYRELEAKYTNSTKVTSIGKTLIVTNPDQVYYFLWKNTTVAGVTTPDYENIGPIPDAKFDFWMERDQRIVDTSTRVAYDAVQKDGLSGDIFDYDSDKHPTEVVKPDEYDDLLIGLYSSNKKAIATKKKFCRPFFVRTALELHDGTLTHISQPVLMVPFIKDNSFALSADIAGIRLQTFYASLYFTQTQDFSDWADIIKDIVIFVSNEIEIYDLIQNQPSSQITGNAQSCTISGIYRFDDGLSDVSSFNTTSFTINDPGIIAHHFSYYSYQPLRRKPENDLLNDLKSVSNFYKLCEVGTRVYSSKTTVEQFFDSGVLSNITTQERLPYDDYYSRCQLSPLYMYAYNSRLNLANVKRSMFEGYGFFLPFDNNAAATYDFYVRIQTDVEKIWVHHQETTKQKQGVYFYYPDSRADRVTIYKTVGSTTTCVCDHALTEHQGLNGAYYLKGLPGTTAAGLIDEETVTVDSIEGFDPNRTIPDINNRTNNDFKERLPNYIIQSEVNCPWVFTAKGYNKVGTGKIIGMSTTTQALSQAQFGAFPLLVFSESGIWAMSVDSTGLYSDIQPIGRDVCINPSSILQTDGAVFFVSKKGLMVAERAGNGLGVRIACVSMQMNGQTFNTSTLTPLATGTDWAAIVTACQTSRSFLDYIRDTACFMAYDYIDSRILIVNPNFGFAFAYNIADGTISKTILPAAMTNAVNNYPDYLLQGTVTVNGTPQTRLYSFYEKQREEEVSVRSLAFLLTRPMKLAGPVSQSSLRQLKNVGTWLKEDAQGNELSCVKTEVYLSEDIQKWYSDISRHGAAARYYRLALYIKMLPTERLSGTILTEQERRSNNIR